MMLQVTGSRTFFLVFYLYSYVSKVSSHVMGSMVTPAPIAIRQQSTKCSPNYAPCGSMGCVSIDACCRSEYGCEFYSIERLYYFHTVFLTGSSFIGTCREGDRCYTDFDMNVGCYDRYVLWH